MDETKKYIIAGLIFFVCVILIAGTDSNFSSKINTENDKMLSQSSPLLFSEASDKMPPMSTHQYGMDEYQILNDIVSQGMIISQYKRNFTNTMRNNTDINMVYSDFIRDFEEYRKNLQDDLIRLKSMNPRLENAQYEQGNTIEKVERLYTKISDYKNHTTHVNDTVSYLRECEYELRRVSAQSKLPLE